MANIKNKLDSVIEEAAQELQEDVAFIKNFWKIYKNEGAKGLAKNIPELWDEIKKDKSLIKAIKVANDNPFKYPEFILISLFLTFNFVYLSVTSQFVSSHINAPAAAILSVYILANTYERVRRRDIEKNFPMD
jgi:uncharacterized membrane protein YesL